MDLLRLPIPALVDRVRRGESTASELARASLTRISERAQLGAFLTVNEEGALRDAAAVDARRARGEELGPLAGVPVAVKDALATSDQPTTAASRILLRERSDPPDPRHGYVPPYDATVVARLRGADAVIVGKTNMDEFAMGSSNENSAFFVARNPHDPTRTPGGSSGGSAVAVAAGMVPLAIGSDTGGSIRQPASLCGVIGLKPTYGRVSRYGLFAFASSLDQVGVFTGDTASAELALRVIGGHDARDATSARRGVEDLASTEAGVRGLRVGVPREYFGAGVAPGVARVVRAAIDTLAQRGATLVDVSLPTTRFGVAAYYVLATAEASSNLARYDGVRFGVREADGSLSELYKRTRGAGFGDEVKRRIILGTFVLSSGYYDAYYVRAQRVRRRIAEDFARVFEDVDLLATPTSPTVAFELGSKQGDPLAMYLADVCTLPASLAGVPAVSVPCGAVSPEEGGPALPVGLQLIAPHFAEARLLRAAAVLGEGPEGARETHDAS